MQVFCGWSYRKIPKTSPRAYIFQRPFLRGLYTEGNLRFKTDWASLIIGRKFTVFACFYFVFEGNFPSTSPQGGLYLEGRFNALPVWRAFIWRGLFSEFYGILRIMNKGKWVSSFLKTMPSVIEFLMTLTSGASSTKTANNEPAMNYRRILIVAIFHFVHPVEKDS